MIDNVQLHIRWWADVNTNKQVIQSKLTKIEAPSMFAIHENMFYNTLYWRVELKACLIIVEKQSH